ncbi:MAG: beta strand repeat-containing protein [Janthinobacterium lividum]
MTIHAWKPTASGFILDATRFADGLAFAPGDTLVVNDGAPSAQGSNGQVEALTPGTYDFDVTGASASLVLKNIRLDSATTLEKSGPGSLAMTVSGQLVNDGTIGVGTAASPSATGSVYMGLGTLGGNTAVTNNGRIDVGGGASLILDAILDTPNIAFLNTSTGTVTVADGASFTFDGNNGDTFRNDGLIVLDGAAGPGVSFQAPTYSGTGTLLVSGHAGAAMSASVATFYGPASGTFGVASGELDFAAGYPVQGAIDFYDADASLNLEGALTTETTASTNPLGATINGFRAGDQILLNGAHSPTFSYVWTQAAHTLTLYAQPGLQGAVDAVLTFGGTYATADFQLETSGALRTADGEPLRSSGAIIVTTTSTANALAAPALPPPPAPPPAAPAPPAGVVVNSTAAGDVVTAGSGNETVYASGATATVVGGAGNLTFVAGGGSYTAGGGSGTDILYGGTGANVLTGGGGANSILVAGAGNATLSGGSGRAALMFGGQAATTFQGGTGGGDTLVGGVGANVFAMTAGDVAFGGPNGPDTFAGGYGSALVVEGPGATQVNVGAATLTAFAGTGADTYAFGMNLGGGASIVGFKATDRIVLTGGFTNADAARALATATTGSFGTALALGDGTRITLFGAGITAAQIT